MRRIITILREIGKCNIFDKKGAMNFMDFLLAICRSLLLFLENDDVEMSTLMAKSFLVINEEYITE
jgi:hypothetical protein